MNFQYFILVVGYLLPLLTESNGVVNNFLLVDGFAKFRSNAIYIWSFLLEIVVFINNIFFYLVY